MSDKELCPICGAELTVESFYLDAHILMEMTKTCTSCHNYTYEELTGAYRVYIGDKEFTWSYLTPYIEQLTINAYIELAIKEYISNIA